MVRTTKVFLIIGMILTFYLIFPLILGLIALSKINNSESVDEIRSWGIITLLFVNIVAGILMLNIREEDLELERKRTGYIREENYYIDFEDEEILVSERITPEQYIEGIIGLTKSLDKVLDNNGKKFLIPSTLKVLVNLSIIDYGYLKRDEREEELNESLFLVNIYLVFFNKNINQKATRKNIQELSNNIKLEINKIKMAQ